MGQSQSNTTPRPSSEIASPKNRSLDLLVAQNDNIELVENKEKGREITSPQQRRNSTFCSWSIPTWSRNAANPGTGPSSITTLPTELHLALFKLLDPVTSTCLGLTCKAFYAIHWSDHGRVPLWAPEKHIISPFSIPYSYSGGLWNLLEDWFPADMSYNWMVGRYMDEKQYDDYVRDILLRAEIYQVMDWGFIICDGLAFWNCREGVTILPLGANALR